MALAYGLGIRDFSKPGEYRLSDMWKNKQKHIDGYNIMESLRKYPQIPMTFGGELPLESEDIGNRVQVVEKYFFEDFGDKGVVAEVTSATISASEKKMYITIYTEDRETHIITREVTDRELEVYRAHTDGFFGIVQRQGEQIEDPYKLLEWMMEGYKDTPRERLLEMCRERPDLRQLEKLDDTEIRLALCESWTAALVHRLTSRKLNPLERARNSRTRCDQPGGPLPAEVARTSQPPQAFKLGPDGRNLQAASPAANLAGSRRLATWS